MSNLQSANRSLDTFKRRHPSRTALVFAWVICLPFWALFSSTTYAQGLQILSTTPADSTTGVPLEGAVEFEFDQAIDTTALSENGLPIGAFIGPRDSLTIRQHRIGGERTRLTVEVGHTPDTDYAWVVTGVEGADTTSLDVPFVLRYTTAFDWGAYAVRGFVARMWLVKRGDPDPRDVVVALLDEPPVVDSNGAASGFGRIVAAVVVPEDGEFEIDRVRNGTYWPVAFIDIDGNGRINGEDRVVHDVEYGGGNITVQGEDVDDVELYILIGGSAEAPEQPAPAQIGEIYPNPTPGAATVEFELTRPAKVHLGLFNLLGQSVHPVVDGRFTASGSHRVSWDASALAAGAYICRLQVDGAIESRLLFIRK